MNKIAAAIAFMDTEMPKPNAIRELVIQAYLAHLTESVEAHGDSDVMEPLIHAYNAMDDLFRDAKGEAVRILCPRDTAEKMFLAEAKRGYREHIPNEVEDSEAFPWWPDFLPLKGGLYTSELVREFGYLAGYHDGQRSLAMFKYFREMQEGEAEKDSKL